MTSTARRPEGDALQLLVQHLREVDPLLAAAAQDPSAGADTAVGEAAAAGDPAYALTVEAAREGQLVHTGRGRVVDGADADLAILAGDHLYAFGLGRLAANGDLPSVAALADTIAACAQAHAEGAPDRALQAWSDGAARIAARDRAR